VERHVELLAAAGFGQFRHHDARQRFVTSVITARRL
jgi:hypothetical protein